MHKWKQDYLFQKQDLTKDESGLTLIEILAALSIFMVVILFAGSIHIFGQQEFIHQTQSANQANDLNYALTILSTELRIEKNENVEVNNNEIYINGNRVFYLENRKLYKGSTFIADSVDRFQVDVIDNGLELSLESSVERGRNKKYETTIYFRDVTTLAE